MGGFFAKDIKELYYCLDYDRSLIFICIAISFVHFYYTQISRSFILKYFIFNKHFILFSLRTFHTFLHARICLYIIKNAK